MPAHTPLAGPVAVIGDGRSYITALVTLDSEAAARLAGDKPVPALAADPAIHAAVDAGIRAANATLSRVEQIKRFTIVPEVWEPGSAFLTPTAKLKRASIQARYGELIDAIYTPATGGTHGPGA